MGFSRLKLILGMALIIFALVTADLIILGQIEKKILIDVDKRQCLVVTKETIYNITNVTVTIPSQPTTNTGTTPTPNPPVVVKTPTRAS